MVLKTKRASALVFMILILASFSLDIVALAPTVKGAVLYDSGNPTPDEQLVLELINRARSDPIAEGQRLGIDIHEGLPDPSLVGPRPPLAMNPILLSTASAHSQDMYNQNYFSHDDPNGTTPFQRMINAGYDYIRGGENMAAGSSATAAELEDFMMVDAGTPGRPHRVNLLDLINAYPCSSPPCVYSEVGIGYYQGAAENNMGLSSLITEDFGATTAGPFLLGVVYNVQNGNNFYDPGEGIAGVTITTSAGGYYAVSSSSGGYAIPIPTSGTITVTASGSGFGPITKTVTLEGVNVKLDFTTSAQIISTTSTSLQATTSSTIVSTSLTTFTTSSTLLSTSSTGTTTTSSQTTTSVANPPFITLSPTSAPVGSTIVVGGSGFSASDTTCSLYGTPVLSFTCAASNGKLTGSFVVANVSPGYYTLTVTGTPTGDQVSALFTVNLPAGRTTTSTSTATIMSTSSSSITTTSSSTSSLTKTADFGIASSSSVITLTRGESGSVQITVRSLNGLDSAVALTASWTGSAPAGVALAIASSVVPSSGSSVTAQLIVTANSTASLGVFVIHVTGVSGSSVHAATPDILLQITTPPSAVSTSSTTLGITSSTTTTNPAEPPPVPTCTVSSIISGSELESLAQELRTFRDQSIMKTRSGVAFMLVFNAWYYSFSPYFAVYVSSHAVERTVLRYGLYPLIAILYASYYSYLVVSPLSPEAAALTAGIVAATLLGLVYLAPLGWIGKRILRHYARSTSLKVMHMTLWCGVSVLMIEIAYNSVALAAVTVNLVLSMLVFGGVLGSAVFSYLTRLRFGIGSVLPIHYLRLMMTRRWRRTYRSFLLR